MKHTFSLMNLLLVWVLLIASSGCTLLGLGTPQNFEKPVWSPDGKKIAFETDALASTPAIFAVFTINADGSQMTKLADGSSPTWSPDGTRIAYQYAGIHVINADGSNRAEIAKDGQLPAWSPDGKRIAFHSPIRGNRHEVYVVSADSTQQTILGNGYNVVWSPDSTTIAFNWDDVNVMRIDGSHQIQLKGLFLYPKWSPDGKKIATNGIYVSNSDGSNQSKLARGSNPTWSPDNKQIAFDDAGEIYVISVGGSGQIRLASGREPAWSPDGRKIALVCKNQGRGDIRNDICVMNSDGSDIKNLTAPK